MNLYDAIKKILIEWSQEKENRFAQNQLASFIRNNFPKIIENLIPVTDDFQIKGSAGAGNWADVPWASILNTKISNTTQDGIYPVYLFKSDGSGVYLSLNQGTTNPKNILGKVEAEKRADIIKKEILSFLVGLESWNKTDLDLKANTPLGLSYEKPNIFSKFYSLDNLPKNEILESDLQEMMRHYISLEQFWLENFAEYTVSNAFLKKINSIKTDTSSGIEKLYKPCLLLAAIKQNENHFQKSKIRSEYKKILQEKKIEDGSSFDNPFNGLVKDGLWGIQNNEGNITSFSDEDWKYIEGNREKVENFILDKWFEINSHYKNAELNKNFFRAFQTTCFEVGLQLGKKITNQYCSSLFAKPFLILTGLSGSGKTQIARAFSMWLCNTSKQIKLVAVGADWTNNENLVGYPNALENNSYKKPDNGALDLILNAKNDPENPYFLILDEMNLSHVERYFADFLSAMESEEPIHLHDDTGTDWDGVPAKLTLPKNLFVIGTVNVDETTYMFSPKVLDRANVIEFRVSKDEIRGFLESPKKPDLENLSGLGAIYAQDFVKQATTKEFELESETKIDLNRVLTELFPELQKCGAEFGYRTAYEISRFVFFHQKYSESPLNDAIDAAIMQKILPKLHGSRKKLGPVLEVILEFCIESKDEETKEVKYKFRSSAEKIIRMQKRLQENGFTSFAEA